LDQQAPLAVLPDPLAKLAWVYKDPPGLLVEVELLSTVACLV
jgi:hypothetical protein